jgi:hypothetical protein
MDVLYGGRAAVPRDHCAGRLGPAAILIAASFNKVFLNQVLILI